MAPGSRSSSNPQKARSASRGSSASSKGLTFQSKKAASAAVTPSGSRASSAGPSARGTTSPPPQSEIIDVDEDDDEDGEEGYDSDQDEAILQRKIQKWTSKVYEHFEKPTIQRDSDNAVVRNNQGSAIHVFICKTTKAPFHRPAHDSATSNLKKHVESCQQAAQLASMTKFLAGSSYTREKLRWRILVWIIRNNLPFAIVESSEFRDIIFLFNPHADIESRTTLVRDIELLFELAQQRLIERFKDDD
ncbi:hypothetical protein SISSUDRAFT_1067593 [Sistotremastrum suecicum HHB10207 ss-3]|uniref:Uncharacterized protein n=1 Tax=Sistotremastrum suecicum HHB10207 ss-3 TaxID=1314776 RepID=A0A165WY42_9AGAM|nr:hypothetical protein SISSUDRAFT_1067593 [Sistotremastrum suecicum HHB10207 ss-3]